MPRLGCSCSHTWVPFSADSLEVVGTDVSDASISLQDGRCFIPKASLEVSAFEVGDIGSTTAAISATRRAAAGLWLRRRKRLTCRRAALSMRVRHLYAISGAAFLYGVEGRTLSTSIWRQCTTLDGRSLRAIAPYAAPRGQPWHAWGPAATRVQTLTLQREAIFAAMRREKNVYFAKLVEPSAVGAL